MANYTIGDLLELFHIPVSKNRRRRLERRMREGKAIHTEPFALEFQGEYFGTLFRVSPDFARELAGFYVRLSHEHGGKTIGPRAYCADALEEAIRAVGWQDVLDELDARVNEEREPDDAWNCGVANTR